MTATNRLQLHLSGTDLPDGEIELADLAEVSRALQDLNTRIGRLVVGQANPGRTFEVVARSVSLRLRGVEPGSVNLMVVRGAEDSLPEIDTLADDVDAHFWEVVAGIRDQRPPTWTEPGIAESTLALIEALSHAARGAEFTDTATRAVAWRTREVDRGVWRSASELVPTEAITVAGRLEAVDLRNGKFRIRDDVGNAILLDGVQDSETAAHLIGSRAVANGVAIRTSAGRLRFIQAPAIAAAPLPAEWVPPRVADLSAELAKPGPTFAGVDGITDADVDDFLAAIR